MTDKPYTPRKGGRYVRTDKTDKPKLLAPGDESTTLDPPASAGEKPSSKQTGKKA